MYEKASGTNSNFTLSDSITNYKYVEIYYTNPQNSGSTTRQCSTKIDTSISTTVSLIEAHKIDNPSSGQWYMSTCQLSFSGTTATFSRTGEIELNTGSYNTYSSSNNNLYVVKVIGYR